MRGAEHDQVPDVGLSLERQQIVTRHEAADTMADEVHLVRPLLLEDCPDVLRELLGGEADVAKHVPRRPEFVHREPVLRQAASEQVPVQVLLPEDAMHEENRRAGLGQRRAHRRPRLRDLVWRATGRLKRTRPWNAP